MTPQNDRGNATIAAAGMVAALIGLVWIAAVAGGMVSDTHRARNAADLAAVAGATALSVGEPPCAVAHQVAQENRAEIEECTVADADVIVTARVNNATGTARAGPL